MSGTDDNKPMSEAQESESVRRIRKRKPLFWAIVRTVFGLALFYYVTATAVPPLIRHAANGGKLTWLPQAAIRVLEAYRVPVEYLCVASPLCRAFEFGTDVWWRVLDPPESPAKVARPKALN